MDGIYDAVIVGAGPAGLTAAIYLARAKASVLVIEKDNIGGQITITSNVENYPGIMKTDGQELTQTMKAQALEFGAKFLAANVTDIKKDNDIITLTTSVNDVSCLGVLIATGAHPRKPGFKGESKFAGHGVAYCATCDGEFFTGMDVFVIGGGYSAAQESVFLTRYASSVRILMITDDFTCAKAVAEEAYKNEKITVFPNTELLEASGDALPKHLRCKNNITGEVICFDAGDKKGFGIFVFAGYEPASQLLEGKARLDEYGYVVTDFEMRTTMDGVYAAGDVRKKTLRQAVTAAGDGALAADGMERYIFELQRKIGVKTNKIRKKKQEIVSSDNEFFTGEMLMQLKSVFDKMKNPVIISLHAGEDEMSNQLYKYVSSLCAMTDKLSFEESVSDRDEVPYVSILRANREDTGQSFHGVPGGHEFTPFILSLYNASENAPALKKETVVRIQSVDRPVNIKILVSLSCMACPGLVISAQKIAAANPLVSAAVYDLRLFPDLLTAYDIMSVPCLVLNDFYVTFGKKNEEEILDIIQEKVLQQ